jgi:hypothetical protein
LHGYYIHDASVVDTRYGRTMTDQLDAIRDKMLESELRPRPRGVPGMWRTLVKRLSDPDWLSSPIMTDGTIPVVRLPRARQQDLSRADLYFVSPAVAQTVAYLAHLQGVEDGVELGDRVRTLLPETPPGPYGFLVWGLPVAWRDPIFEIAAVSWAPARGEANGRGVDLVAWAALTRFAVESAMGLAGQHNTPYARAQAYGSLGPLLPIELASLGYRQPTDADTAEWVHAVQATWAAMGTEETLVKMWRPSWLDRLRGRGSFPSDGSPFPMVNCLRLRPGVRPPQLADHLCR